LRMTQCFQQLSNAAILRIDLTIFVAWSRIFALVGTENLEQHSVTINLFSIIMKFLLNS
jgi:hypothetical protein